MYLSTPSNMSVSPLIVESDHHHVLQQFPSPFFKVIWYDRPRTVCIVLLYLYYSGLFFFFSTGFWPQWLIHITTFWVADLFILVITIRLGQRTVSKHWWCKLDISKDLVIEWKNSGYLKSFCDTWWLCSFRPRFPCYSRKIVNCHCFSSSVISHPVDLRHPYVLLERSKYCMVQRL